MVEKKSVTKDQAKLPKLQITQFNGTAADWVPFENMFITQIDKKQVLMKSSLVIFLKWYVHMLEQELPTLSQVA